MVGMSRNGQPYIQTDWTTDQPICLVCEKPLTTGQKVVVSVPEMLFIHLDCVENQDEAREIMDRHRETGGK